MARSKVTPINETRKGPQITNIVDKRIPTPESIGEPKEIHILLNSRVVDLAGKYKDALFIARGIPFSTANLPITDPLAMMIATQYPKMSGDEVVRRAASWYDKWAQEAEQEAWTMAMLYDNKLVNEPTPYDEEEEQEPAPGLPFEPSPKRNLEDPAEYRLKQIIDLSTADMMFGMRLRSAINEAFKEAINFAAETDEAGFQA